MKRIFSLSFVFMMILCLHSVAQLPSLEISSDSKTGQLLPTDPINAKYHYKQLPFSMKKGMGAVFFMQSSSFKPRLLLFSTGDGKLIGSEYNKSENGANESIISFVAPIDTSFLLILTSLEENSTGDFVYGYSILDSSQMSYKYDFTACQKLYYLINQWQLSWELIPVTKGFHADTEDPEASYEYRKTNNTLVNGSQTEILGQYTEILYSASSSSKMDYKDDARNFFIKTCREVKACLENNEWKVETESNNENKNLFSSKVEEITHFYLKNAGKNVPSKSFKVIYVHGDPYGLFPHEVKLVFN